MDLRNIIVLLHTVSMLIALIAVPVYVSRIETWTGWRPTPDELFVKYCGLIFATTAFFTGLAGLTSAHGKRAVCLAFTTILAILILLAIPV